MFSPLCYLIRSAYQTLRRTSLSYSICMQGKVTIINHASAIVQPCPKLSSLFLTSVYKCKLLMHSCLFVRLNPREDGDGCAATRALRAPRFASRHYRTICGTLHQSLHSVKESRSSRCNRISRRKSGLAPIEYPSSGTFAFLDVTRRAREPHQSRALHCYA